MGNQDDGEWANGLALRDVSMVEFRQIGGVVAATGNAQAFEVLFPSAVRAATAANAFLVDLADTYARPLTLRSYGFDILRWLRFLDAIGIDFDRASRGDYTDFRRWLDHRGKTGGARREPKTLKRPGFDDCSDYWVTAWSAGVV